MQHSLLLTRRAPWWTAAAAPTVKVRYACPAAGCRLSRRQLACLVAVWMP